MERGKCIPLLVLQLLHFAITVRQLAQSSSSPIFSPLSGKFCNIYLFPSYRKDVSMTKDHKQNTLSPPELNKDVCKQT